MRTKTTLFLTLLAALLLAACGSVKIGRINADPTRYQNKTVRVTGTVIQSMGVLGTGGYQIQDESGKIYVISGPGVPTVLIGSQPAAVVGDMCVCVGPPDSIVNGSTSVLIGGRPAARMGDPTAHGGTITLGFPTVLIG